MQLELASTKDWQEISEFKKNAQSRVFHAYTSEEDVTKMIKDDKVFFATYENKKIGIIAYHENQDNYYMSDFIIAKAYQGKGLGLELLKTLIEQVGKEKPYELVTHPENTPAIITYLKAGFKIKAWKENYFGDGEPRILLVKEVS